MNGHQDEPTSTENVTEAPPPPAVETSPQIFKCPTCSREFGNALALQTHEIRAHKKFWSTFKPGNPRPRKKGKHKRLNIDLVCPVCRKSDFSNKATLGTHIRQVHHRSSTDFPGFRAAGPRKFGGHKHARMGRKPNPNPSKECPVCHLKYATRAIMGNHLRKYHGKSLNDFPTDPPAIMASANGARRSPKPKHKRGADTCPVCNKNFSTGYLPSHMRTQHGTTLGKAKRAAAEGEPTGETARVMAEARTQKKPEGRPVIYCPVCGTNIHNIQTAINFGEQHT
jgi:Zn finger protein HypA/HybF involved in hydrogenase expression